MEYDRSVESVVSEIVQPEKPAIPPAASFDSGPRRGIEPRQMRDESHRGERRTVADEDGRERSVPEGHLLIGDAVPGACGPLEFRAPAVSLRERVRVGLASGRAKNPSRKASDWKAAALCGHPSCATAAVRPSG